MCPVRAVLFDLDDTLFDHQHCARAALVAVRDGHACFAALDPSELEASHARILEELHRQVLTGRVALDAARVERFRRLYAWAGIEAGPEMAALAAAAYRTGYIEARTPVRGAAALLAALQPHARIVVVSNNLLAEQREKLRDCGLERYVDALVVSEEAGIPKPDPAIFRIALERAGVEAAEAVMIGDSWPNDIEGARAAGIRAIWFNRNGESAPDAEIAVIHSLEPAEEVRRLVLASPDVRPERVSALRQ